MTRQFQIPLAFGKLARGYFHPCFMSEKVMMRFLIQYAYAAAANDDDDDDDDDDDTFGFKIFYRCAEWFSKQLSYQDKRYKL
jgi:hypothetical protein